jgi:5-methylcytosine-specific restriction endonuclease McrA
LGKGGPSKRKRVPSPADLYRYKKEWKKKSKEILERDNHACVECGSTHGLDAHHSYPLNDWIDDGHDPDEWLMTLDKSCHSKADMSDGVFKYPPREA